MPAGRALESQIAAFDLYRPGHLSFPWGFRNLMMNIHFVTSTSRQRCPSVCAHWPVGVQNYFWSMVTVGKLRMY